MATIEPPIAGVTVYFTVFDVDDPFDQLHPDMPAVGEIDNDAAGAANRPSPDLRYFFSATTDESGKASIMFIVSMQPGNNWRAGASVLEDTIQKADQTIADSLGHGFAGWLSFPQKAIGGKGRFSLAKITKTPPLS